MNQSKRTMPLFLKLLCWIMGFLLIVIAFAMVVTMRFTLDAFQGKVDSVLFSTVRTLSEMPEVRESLLRGQCSGALQDFLDDVVAYTENMDYITVADTDSIRIYHIDPQYIGMPFEGGDQYRALAGETYLSDASPVHFEDQHRAFHPVFDEEGSVIGFVMASASMHHIDSLQRNIYHTYFRYFLLLVAASLMFSGFLAVYLGRNLRGIRPEDLLRMYLAQNDILNSLDEGLVSFDLKGKVRLVNHSAARMLGHREDLLLGRNVDDLLRDQEGLSLRDRQSGVLQSDHANILVRVVQLPNSNLWARQVLILADKSEVIRYTEQLGGTRHMINTLRANTHEFLNKLQVISGLLQMGYVNEAVGYIGNIATHHEQSTGPVLKLIRNPNVAALILGKVGSLRELDISFVLLNNSSLPEQSRYLSTNELVTLVGNLLENAMEAVNAVPTGELRAVSLQITEDDKGLLVIVSDTGEGIAEKDLPHIFKQGFTTKAAESRGLGMWLIKEIVDRHGGSMDVDTELGSGTTFAIIFNQERGDSE